MPSRKPRATDRNEHPVPLKAIERYRAAQAAIKKWEEVKAAARAEIEKALGEAETGTVYGIPVVTYKHVKSNRLNQELLKTLHPDVHAECMEISESRRFVLVEHQESEEE